MQVITPNNVKIYNLSAGKSLPDWISDRKKRDMLKKDSELRERIELIQDFEMPIVSNQVQISPDGQYIYATGVYKPRVRCFDTSQLSMKFERCFDSECVKFKILSEDYSKVVFMHNDRYIEFHAQYGKYYKTRIPKFGNDFDYHYSSCDLYFVGTSNEIFRLNLEQGKYLTSLVSASSQNNCCQFNPAHELFVCGNVDGCIECWDPRAPKRISLVDCRLDSYLESSEAKKGCSITALKFRDGLNLVVGTSTGHVLLYDLRSTQPVYVKDHRFELPIKDIVWHDSSDNIISMDKRCCKIWNRYDGKPFTSIEPGTGLNNLCVAPDSGMMFLANEAPKVLVYYIPTLGPAPKWCSFLDNLTEELETSSTSHVYDDYKFVTKQEVDNIGLAHLIGSNVLKAYMHGYFMDIRLYKKAKQIAEPFNYEEYKRNKIKELIDKERSDRVKIHRLPQVNKDLARKLNEDTKDKKKGKVATDLLEDNRFSQLFNDPRFQIDHSSEEFRLLNPVVQKINEKITKNKVQVANKFNEVEDDEMEGVASDQESSSGDDGDKSEVEDEESSSDDEHTFKEALKTNYNQLQKEKRENGAKSANLKQPKFYELKEGLEYYSNKNQNAMTDGKMKRLTLETRVKAIELSEKSGLKSNETMIVKNDSFGNKQMTFVSRKAQRDKSREKKADQHHTERKKLRRSAESISKSLSGKSKFFKKPK